MEKHQLDEAQPQTPQNQQPVPQPMQQQPPLQQPYIQQPQYQYPPQQFQQQYPPMQQYPPQGGQYAAQPPPYGYPPQQPYYPQQQLPAGYSKSDMRKRSSLGRNIIDKHGEAFLTPTDKKIHNKMSVMYKLGVAAMLLSFPLSFHYSRKITIDKARANKYLMQNLGMSTLTCGFFAWTMWNRGTTEEDLAKKYLWMFNNQELEHFELNKQFNISRIQQLGGQQHFVPQGGQPINFQQPNQR